MSNRNDLYRSLFETASEAILVMQNGQSDSAWDCVDCNTSAITLFDCDKEDLLGQTLLDFSPPIQPDGRDSKLVLGDKLEAALAGEIQRFEWLHQRLNGEKFYAHVALVWVESEGDAFIQVAVHDITEDKRLEEALSETEKRFRTILDSVQAGVIIIDADKREIVDVNSAGLQMIGAKRENVIGSICHQFICPAEQGQCPVCDLGQQVDNSERVLITANNERLPIIKYVVPVTLDNRNYLIESFVDITERKRVEEELRKLSRVVEQSANTIVITDTRGYIEYVNPKFTETTGYTRQEALGQHTRILKSGETSPEEYQALWTTISAGKEWQGEFHNKKKNGELYWEFASISPIRDEQGHITHFLAIKEEITARKQTEEALRLSEARYREVVQNANSIVLQFDSQGCVTFVNEFAQQFFGYALEEILGQNIIGTIVPETESSGRDLAVMIQDLLQHPEQYVANENENIRRSGERVWVSWANRALFDEAGQLTEILCLGQDVTERKRLEQALQESERRLANIIDFLPYPTFAIDTAGKVIAWNRACETALGVKAEEILGQGDYEYALPFYGERRPILIDLVFASPEEIEQNYTNVRREGETLVAEAMVYPQGRERYFIGTAAPLYDAQGNIAGAIETFRDITEQKQSEAARQEFEQRLADIIDFLPTPTFVIDLEGNVIAWNQALVEVTGVKAEDILGKGNYEYALPFFGKRRPLLIDLIFEPEEEVAKKYTNVRREGNSLVAENRVFPRGIERHYLLSAAPLYDAQGNLVGAIENFRDITEQKRAEEELRQYQDQLEELVEARTAELEDRVRELNALQRLMSREGWQEFQAVRSQAAPGYLFDQAIVRPAERDELGLSPNGRSEERASEAPAADKSTRSSAVTKPLAVSGESIGTLGIYDDPDNPLSPEDQAFLDEIASQVAEALERARLLEQSRASLAETEAQAERLAALSALGQELAQTTSIADALNLVATEIESIIGSDLGGLGLFDEATQQLEMYALAGPQGALLEGLQVSIKGSLLGQVFQNQQLLTIPDLQVRDEIDVRDWLEQGMRSATVAPLVASGRVIGTVHVASQKLNAYTEQDGRLMLQVASLLASSLESRRLFEETRQALAEVEATQRRYTVQAWETYRRRKVAASHEQDREGVPPLGDELPPEVSQAVAQKKALAISAIPALSAGADGGQTPSAGAKSSLLVPLTVRDEVIGVLGLQETAEARQWTPEEIALVEGIAEQVALAAEQIRLFDETQQRAAREKRLGEIGDKIRAAQSLEEALQVAIKEVGLSLKAPQTTVQLEVE